MIMISQFAFKWAVIFSPWFFLKLISLVDILLREMSSNRLGGFLLFKQFLIVLL